MAKLHRFWSAYVDALKRHLDHMDHMDQRAGMETMKFGGWQRLHAE